MTALSEARSSIYSVYSGLRRSVKKSGASGVPAHSRGGAVTIREPRPPRPHAAAEEELERHRAFITQLVNPLWARFA